MQTLKEWVICTLVIGGLLLAGATIIITAARHHAAAQPCEAPDTGWEPPKLQLCPEDMELWDCIRNASYRSDI